MASQQPAASTSRPFAAAPDVNRYFPSAAMEEARLRIGRSIMRGEGPVLVIGSAGLGKTLLLQVLAQQFGRELVPVHLMGGQLVTRRALLQMTLFQLGLAYKDMDESELRLSLLAHLQKPAEKPMRILMMVDEADAMPPRLLEELRALTNLCVDGQMQINLVLAGNSRLEEHFADPKQELFSQRVAARCYLAALGREETFQFVRAQVSAAGQDPQELFTEDALEAIFGATDGVPRLVNQLGDQLMWMVQETGVAPLDELIVQQAWSELQQLPAPWNTQEKETQPTEVEFGELRPEDVIVEEVVFDDDDYSAEYEDDLPASIPINGSQPFEADLQDEASHVATFDVTEDLVQKFDALEPVRVDAIGNDHLSITSSNPFAETFESEEIVLDRYSAFESLLLAEAPRVVNQSDASFSQQLQEYQTPEREVPRVENIAVANPIAVEPLDEMPEVSPSVDSSLLPPDSPGELLVIEESSSVENRIVSGQKFRQLFSSLENANNASCIG